jgi:hypothetical protein
MRFVDLVWLIGPELNHGHSLHLSGYINYAIATIGMGGLWLGWFFWQLRQRPLIPYNDPLLGQALKGREHIVDFE